MNELNVSKGYVALCAVVVAAMLLPMEANAALSIDVSDVIEDIKSLKEPISQIGAAMIGIACVIFGWLKVKSMVR